MAEVSTTVALTDAEGQRMEDSAKEVIEVKATYEDSKIDVLAPGVVAATMLYRHKGRNKGKKFVNRGVYTVVLAERDGRMRRPKKVRD